MSGTILDLGSGNGSPGIPLFIGCRLLRADLVEARLKRAAFLRHVVSCLGNENIFIHRLRLEDMKPSLTSDWITLQGVKPVSSLIQALLRLFAPTTRVVWMTSGEVFLPAGAKIHVPESNTVVRVLQLDQF
jgi:16S rRNA (guanine527-N7)-methyltransferase